MGFRGDEEYQIPLLSYHAEGLDVESLLIIVIVSGIDRGIFAPK